MMGFVFSLNAINLCEVAGWKTTPPEIATKIYVTAAFRFKQFAPPVVRLLSVSSLNKNTNNGWREIKLILQSKSY